jgi:hypothetical protein
MYDHPSQPPLRSQMNVSGFPYTHDQTIRSGGCDTYTPKGVSSYGSRNAAQKTQPVKTEPAPSDVTRAQGRFSDAMHPLVRSCAYTVATTNRETGARCVLDREWNSKTPRGVAAAAEL